MESKKIEVLGVKVGWEHMRKDLPCEYKDAWEKLMSLPQGDYVPTSIVQSTGLGMTYRLHYDTALPDSNQDRELLVKAAHDLGWELVNDRFVITTLANVIGMLSEGRFTYTLREVYDGYTRLGFEPQEDLEAVKEALLKAGCKLRYAKNVEYVPYSVNSDAMSPMPRKITEELFVIPPR